MPSSCRWTALTLSCFAAAAPQPPVIGQVNGSVAEGLSRQPAFAYDSSNPQTEDFFSVTGHTTAGGRPCGEYLVFPDERAAVIEGSAFK